MKEFVCCQCEQKKLSGQRYLPGMQAMVCIECIDSGIQPISVKEITNKVFPPWIDEQLKSLYCYQRSIEYFPFVCKNNHVYDIDREGMYCNKCIDRQRWSYSWTLDWSWNDNQNDFDSFVPKKPLPPSDDSSIQLPLPSDEQN